MARRSHESLTRDSETERVRSIKPGEEIISMWDALDTTARAYSWSPNDPSENEEMDEGFEPSYAYTVADELGDALLFSLEANGDMTNNFFRNDPNAMEIFEKETIDVRKFAANGDTDDELMDLDEDFDDDLDSEKEYDVEALDGLEDDDGNSEWESEEEMSDFGDAIDETVDMLVTQMKATRIREPDYFLPYPTNLMHAMRNAFRCMKEYDSSHMGIEANFLRQLTRHSFKHSRHQADQEPCAIAHYAVVMFMISSMDHFIMSNGLNAGVICSSYGGIASGIVTAKAEPNCPMDLYIDDCVGNPAAHITSHLTDPTPLDRDFVIRKVKSFQGNNPAAKFAVLRLWSASHFYPLMLGMDKRPMCAFLDERGRCWEFKFIPKDMPYSEWSVQQQFSLWMEPYR
ncbi:hypothetical protein EK21DRAFT_105292 [Setomelanomma holmii]|uniref:Uncharacterized protein n=1 Tax=Setomelanomma holmii TaxID=210430 RepID=A0A9P4LGR7_9PLEO|nr:hypothetical protein EK21DRAFT_105292 [Setomelanomma holmii]